MNRVVVVGAGRQGPAVAYDLVKFGAADTVTIADFDSDATSAACHHVNQLLGRDACQSESVDATSTAELENILSAHDLAVAAAPYRLNPLVSWAGLKSGRHVVDMGIDTEDALALHRKSAEAKAKAVCIVTDCGVAPGLVNILAYRLRAELPDAERISLYCGGLSEKSEPPFFHRVGFSVESLIGEYVDEVDSLRGGKVVREAALEEFETLDIPGFATLEAVTTSGGTGTAAHKLAGQLQEYVYKTLRYPGHWSAMKFLRDGGFWSDEALSDGSVPMKVTSMLMERAMVVRGDQDVVVARVVAESAVGKKGYDLVDRYDTTTGFSAMQRTTGFSTAIVAAEVLAGRVAAGCRSCEDAVDSDRFFFEAEKRGLVLRPIVF